MKTFDSSGDEKKDVSAWLGSTAPTVGQKTSANSLPIVVASDQSAVPVSGTVTANIGTSGSLALDSTLTGGTQKTKLIDTGGTNVASVSAAGALKVDGSAATQPVSGTVTANIGTSGSLALDASVTGLQVTQGSTTSGEKGPLVQAAVTTSAPSYTTAQTSPLSLTTGGLLRVDSSGATQPVSGTVTANIGTSGSLALDASVTGLQVSQGSTTSGQKESLVAGAVTTSAPSYTTAQSSPLSLTTAGGLRVDGSGVTQPVSGTVTANAGTGTFNIQANASVNINQVSGSAVSTSATGVQKVGTVGNAGGIFDFAGQNATSPANAVLHGGQFNTTPTTITTGNSSPLQLDSTGSLKVNINAQSLAQVTVQGAAASGVAVAGNPLLTGVRAASTNPTAVADGQAVSVMGTKLGKIVTMPMAPRDLQTRATLTLSASTAETTLLSAGGAGVFLDLAMLIITSTSAVATRIDFRDSTGGTVRFSIGIAGNGGAVVPFTTPWGQTTANNNWTAQSSTSVTDIRIAALAIQAS